jgi:outer membrane protein TolC
MSVAGSVEKAKADLEKIKRQWNLDWMEATQSFEIAKSRLRSLEQIGLPSSRRAYDASIIAYEVGELGVTDLLASFLEKQEAELDYLEAQRELWRWKTRIDILKASQY